MSQLNLHLSDDTQARLRALAKARGLTLTTMFTLLVDREWRETTTQGDSTHGLTPETNRVAARIAPLPTRPHPSTFLDDTFAPADDADALTLEPYQDANR